VSDSDIASLKRHSIRGSGLSFAAQGVRFVIKLGSQILIARLLQPSDYGLVAMVAPILSLGYLMGELGLGQVVVLHPDPTREEVSSLFWFSLALNSVLALGLMLLSPAIAWLYHEPRTTAISLVLAALLPITGMAGQHIALLNRHMRFSALAILDVLPPFCGLVTGLVAAHGGWSYWSLVAYAVAESLATVATAWSLSSWRPGRPSRQPIGKLIKTGGDIAAYNFAAFMAITLDNVLLGVFRGSEALGLYDRGRKLTFQALNQLLAPISRTAIPLLTRLRNDPQRYKNAYLDALRMILLVTVPGTLFAMIMAHPLIVFLLGPRWEGVAPIFSWLCLGELVSPIYSSTFWLFTTQERTRQQIKYVAVTSLITLCAFAAGLPWGPVGVAAGGVLSFALVAIPMVCWGATRKGIVTLRDLLGALWPLAVAGAVCAAVLEFVRDSEVVGGVGSLALTAPLAYGVFIAALLCIPGQLIQRAWHFGRLLAWPQKRGLTKKPA